MIHVMMKKKKKKRYLEMMAYLHYKYFRNFFMVHIPNYQYRQGSMCSRTVRGTLNRRRPSGMKLWTLILSWEVRLLTCRRLCKPDKLEEMKYHWDCFEWVSFFIYFLRYTVIISVLEYTYMCRVDKEFHWLVISK